jgi:hypothetical protein
MNSGVSDEIPGGRQSPGDHSATGVLGPKDTIEAQEAGRLAAFTGEPVTVCPWAEAADDRQAALRLAWVRGYAAGRTDLRAARDPGQPAEPPPRQSPPQ